MLEMLLNSKAMAASNTTNVAVARGYAITMLERIMTNNIPRPTRANRDLNPFIQTAEITFDSNYHIHSDNFVDIRPLEISKIEYRKSVQ
jgi:hypothetical protein